MAKVGGVGPQPAKIMIVGEFPKAEEERAGQPFVGAAGQELTRMLHDAGIDREECRLVYVTKYRPVGNNIGTFFYSKAEAKKLGLAPLAGKFPKRELQEGLKSLALEFSITNPNVVITLGDTALWALTGLEGTTSWRGSILNTELESLPRKFKVVPTYDPEAVLRMWNWRYVAVNDLRRARNEAESPEIPDPGWRFITAPTYSEVTNELHRIRSQSRLVAADIETNKGHITCIGLSGFEGEAVCIPFVHSGNQPYWTAKEEFAIVLQLKEILTDKAKEIVWQNGQYDAQYLAKWWGFLPSIDFDTIIAHHTCFAGLPKSLDFLSSLYLPYHRYWKNELRAQPDEVVWAYNCKDAVITRALVEPLKATVAAYRLEEVFKTQMSLNGPTLQMMLRGVAIDHAQTPRVLSEVEGKMEAEERFFTTALGHPFNPRSNPQMQTLLYTDFSLPVQRNRKTGKPTCNSDALKSLGRKEPILKPVLDSIVRFKELGVLKSTFLEAKLDTDNRMHSSFSITGTETYRFSSSTSAFWNGLNMQNIPPELRYLYVPDAGYIIVDCDLDRADLQVVVWEADDPELKQVLREGVDVHTENAKTIGCTRPQAKAGVHATNYGAKPRTLATTLGITVKEAEAFQKRWFEAHPGIKEWHQRTEEALWANRMVANRFGYRRYYFDRVEGLLPQALAWVPQSTVGIVTNLGMLNIHKKLPEVQLLIQVHDSLVMQLPEDRIEELLPQVIDCMKVTVPYDDPLVIGVGAKISPVSWGDCEEYSV